jgi:hypothetical protein
MSHDFAAAAAPTEERKTYWLGLATRYLIPLKDVWFILLRMVTGVSAVASMARLFF